MRHYLFATSLVAIVLCHGCGGDSEPSTIDASTAGQTDAGAGGSDASVSLGELLLYSPFNVPVARDAPTADERIANRTQFMMEGWESMKGENLRETPGGLGYFYTVTPAEFATNTGTMGPIPGAEPVERVGVIEAAGESTLTQTDFYLQIGRGDGVDRTKVPGDVYFQHWLFVNASGSQVSEFSRRAAKWIYPCNGNYACNTQKWMLQIYGDGDMADGIYFALRDENIGNFDWPNAEGGLNHVLVQHLSPGTYVRFNQWWLSRWHIKTTGETSGNMYEHWIRPQNGEWVKVAEYISSDTAAERRPDDSFVWTIPASDVNGHSTFKFVTTVPANNSPEDAKDFWIYIKDFAMATSADQLPVYPDQMGANP